MVPVKGRDEYWNEHSVRVPLALSKTYPDDLTILPHNAFYWPLWTSDQLELIYGSSPSSDARGTLANHLWEFNVWEEYLEKLTPGKVRRIDSNFHLWARTYLGTFSDDYGSPSLLDKCHDLSDVRNVNLFYKLLN